MPTKPSTRIRSRLTTFHQWVANADRFALRPMHASHNTIERSFHRISP
jgi:hypothetical protein